MATKEECIKAVEDLSKALNVSSDKSNTITKHLLDISEDDAEKYGDIIGAVKTTYEAMEKLQSNDPTEVISGVLDTVGAFAALAGPAGEVLSGICGLISGLISGSSDDDGDKLQRLIDAALEKSRMSELKEKAAGIGKEFTEWQTYMTSGNSTLTEMDLSDLMRNYDLKTGTGFLGELLEHIKHQKTERKDTDSAKELLHLIKLYCQLSITREMLLHQMYSLIANSEGIEKRPSTIKSYRGVIDHMTSNQDLKFLHCPSLNEIVMASVYMPEEWPEIAKYLKHVGVPDIAKPCRDHQELRVEQWPDYYCIATYYTKHEPVGRAASISYKSYYLTTCSTGKDQDMFFSFKREKNGLLKINSAFPTEANSNGDLSLDERTGYWGLNGENKTSSFKLIITDNDKCLLSCAHSPDQFMYVTKTGYLNTYGSDPGPAGYWKIKTTTDDDIEPTNNGISEFILNLRF